MPFEGLGCLLELVEVLFFWSIYRWLIPISLLVIGGLGFTGFLPVAASIAMVVIGFAWLSYNIWKGFSEGDWGREER
ncbi:MAG: TMEM43 family protein [Fimbriimonadaceae bacterium]|nr:TMEM43 family protein [Fimbriimonadaceae bacterium]